MSRSRVSEQPAYGAPTVPSLLEKLLILYARFFPIRRGKLRVVDSLWRLAVRNGDTSRVTVLKYGGLRMPCDLRDMLHRQFYFFGTYALAEAVLVCWQREAKNASTIVDIGANAGIFSLAALAVHPAALVHAFEPTPEIVDELRATAALNGLERLCVHDVAISDNEGYATLVRYRGNLGTNEGMNFITKGDDLRGDRVKTMTLDLFCAEHSLDRINLLKIDIQGNEHLALAGAAELLSTGRIDTLFVELNWGSDRTVPCPATESIRLLENAGYSFAEPQRHLVWQPAGQWMRSKTDIIAKRKTVTGQT